MVGIDSPHVTATISGPLKRQAISELVGFDVVKDTTLQTVGLLERSSHLPEMQHLVSPWAKCSEFCLLTYSYRNRSWRQSQRRAHQLAYGTAGVVFMSVSMISPASVFVSVSTVVNGAHGHVAEQWR